MAVLGLSRFALVVLSLLATMLAAACGPEPDPSGLERIEVGGEVWAFEVAADDASRTLGLGGRESLPPGQGMLFVFPERGVRRFWMYDCLMPIDLVFLDDLGTITAVHEMPFEPPRAEGETENEYAARLPRYSSRFPVRFALEFPAGTIDRLGLEPNTRIELDAGRLKSLAR
jgi:uncharacterized membrane protein (UPF0127 family)